MCKLNFLTKSSLFAVVSLAGTMAMAEDAKPVEVAKEATKEEAKPVEAPKNPFEFHGYLRLETDFDSSLVNEELNRYDGWWGTNSREAQRAGGWLRLAPQVNFANGSKLVLELEADQSNFNNLDNNMAIFNFNTGSAYYEASISPDFKLWLGQRRFEYEQQRFSGQTLLSPAGNRIRGAGMELKITDSIWLKSSIGVNEVSIYDAGYQKDGKAQEFKFRETEVFNRFEIPLKSGDQQFGTLNPMLGLKYRGKNSQLVELDKLAKIANSAHENYQRQGQLFLNIGASATTWGSGEDKRWEQIVISYETIEASKGVEEKYTYKNGDTDAILKLGLQGGYNSLAKDYNIAFYYGVLSFLEMYKNDHQVLKIANNEVIADGANKTKKAMTVALNLQPIYFITNNVQTALDLGYAHRALVADSRGLGQPDSISFAPIIRYAFISDASQRESIKMPQIYASFYYTKFMAKPAWGVVNEKGEAKDSNIAFRIGYEAEF